MRSWFFFFFWATPQTSSFHSMWRDKYFCSIIKKLCVAESYIFRKKLVNFLFLSSKILCFHFSYPKPKIRFSFSKTSTAPSCFEKASPQLPVTLTRPLIDPIHTQKRVLRPDEFAFGSQRALFIYTHTHSAAVWKLFWWI